MSLIDTVCIGTCGSTLELAALGPASLLFSCASSLFSALTATALSEISTLLARGDSAGASASFGEALQGAMVAGFAVMGIYGFLSVQMIQLLGVAADVVPTAASYLAMRSVAAPAAKGTAICAVSSPLGHPHAAFRTCCKSNCFLSVCQNPVPAPSPASCRHQCPDVAGSTM
jgi:Na+-driven multidrug efflux pump